LITYEFVLIINKKPVVVKQDGKNIYSALDKAVKKTVNGKYKLFYENKELIL